MYLILACVITCSSVLVYTLYRSPNTVHVESGADVYEIIEVNPKTP
jgi:hypothetical protein